MNTQNITEKSVSRRDMLAKSTLALGATALAATAILPSIAKAQNATAAEAPKAAALSASDVEIVTLALTLERLESSYYSQVLGAQAKRSYLSGRLLSLAQEIGTTEAAHVQALEAILTNAGVAIPAAQNFSFPNNVFLSPVAFAWFGHTLEEIGVRAYLGAIGKIKSQSVKEAIASIYGVESRHVALLRTYSGSSVAPNYFESPLSAEQARGLIAPYLA
jgi:hypothetical protein